LSPTGLAKPFSITIRRTIVCRECGASRVANAAQEVANRMLQVKLSDLNQARSFDVLAALAEIRSEIDYRCEVCFVRAGHTDFDNEYFDVPRRIADSVESIADTSMFLIVQHCVFRTVDVAADPQRPGIMVQHESKLTDAQFEIRDSLCVLNKTYQLLGMIFHDGPYITSGHYTYAMKLSSGKIFIILMMKTLTN
jgi:uncharacterized UBP type Zn finger protein